MKTGLQWILQEAKDLRKKYPKRFKNWKQYVAQATAIYNSKNKSINGIKKFTYKINENFDSFKNRFLYKVVGINNDYVGEYHTTKKEAADELNLLNKNKSITSTKNTKMKKPLIKKPSVKKVAGWKKGKTIIIEHNEKKIPNKKNIRVARKYNGSFMHFDKINGIAEKSRYSIALDNLENDVYHPFAPESSIIKAKSILKKWAINKAIDRYSSELNKGKEVLVYIYDKHKETTVSGYALKKVKQKIIKKSL